VIKIARFATENLNGFMDEGASLLGELRFNNLFRIDGRLKGRVISDSTLVVGETGEVEAEIDCRVVSIRGRVTGRVRGRERIELLSGAKVHATLIAPKLVIEEGAFFIGDCEMVPAPPPAPKSLPASGKDAGPGTAGVAKLA
jgi:cytoskeletal protein CcmA (bactofilin family)